MATLERRPTAHGTVHWRARVRLAGMPAQSASFARRREARMWAQQTELDLQRRRERARAGRPIHTVAELIDRFLREELPKRPRSQRLLQAQLQWWRERLGALELEALTPAAVVVQREALRQQPSRSGAPLSAATVNRYLAALSLAVGVAVREWGWLPRNPLQRVRKLREPAGRVRCLGAEERLRLLSACRHSPSPALYDLVLLALATGARKGELLGLTWADVDLTRGRLLFQHTKNGHRRAVPLTGAALEQLRAQAARDGRETAYVFPSARRAGRPAVFEHAWRQALREAGIEDFRFHDLRHSSASYLAMSGATLLEIATVLGHRSLAMVQRYAHLSENHTRQVVTRMTERVLGDLP